MAKAAQPSVVNLGPLEEEVMRTVWRHGLKTVAEVTAKVNEGRPRPLDYRTILTVMSNLTKKKLLRHRRRGNTYHFTPTCTEDEFAYRQGAASVAGLVGRWGTPALEGIVDQLGVPPEVVARLEALASGGRDGGKGESLPRP